MVLKKCIACGVEFKAAHKYNVTCSRSCGNTLRRGNPLSEKRKAQLERLHNQTRQKNGMSGVRRFGEKNPNWKAGLTPLYRRIRALNSYVDWRKNVLVRDSLTCKRCGCAGSEVHHIIPFKQIIQENNIRTTDQAHNCKLLWELSNGITVCDICHKEIHHGRKHDD